MMSPTVNSRFSRARLRRNRNLGSFSATAGPMGPVSMTIVLVMIVGVLALLYLTQITKTTVYGYQVNNLTDQRQSLLNQNQELAVQAARLQAIARVQNSKVVGSLQPESQASFVTSQ